MITIDALSKSYKDKKIINNLNLEVQNNEIVSLLGPNGAGKTTLLNIIAGLIKPDQGNITINGNLVNGTVDTKTVCTKHPATEKSAYVFQTFGLFPHLKVKDNNPTDSKTRIYHKQEIKQRTESMLALVGLKDYAVSYPGQLSGGQKQRVALARSLVTELTCCCWMSLFQLLILNSEKSFRLELQKLPAIPQITVLYVTHNLSEAYVMSDRIAVMGKGHIEQIGAKNRHFFEKPPSRYVAQFLESRV
jgi:ABC-type Fe3+/spermidine/putrescine transport system ATPase subunit